MECQQKRNTEASNSRVFHVEKHWIKTEVRTKCIIFACAPFKAKMNTKFAFYQTKAKEKPSTKSMIATNASKNALMLLIPLRSWSGPFFLCNNFSCPPQQHRKNIANIHARNIQHFDSSCVCMCPCDTDPPLSKLCCGKKQDLGVFSQINSTAIICAARNMYSFVLRENRI